MRYLLLLTLFLTSCSGGLKITDVDHPIDTIKQQRLIETESAIVKIDLFKLSIMCLLIGIIIVAGWWFVALKQTKIEMPADH